MNMMVRSKMSVIDRRFTWTERLCGNEPTYAVRFIFA